MANARPNESQVSYHKRRLEELKSVRSRWETLWSASAEYIEPSRLRLGDSKDKPFDRSKIIDSTGTFAYDTLRSGMHSGVTSPARPWFGLTTLDGDLKDFEPVKIYLSELSQRMREVYQGSNIYNAFHSGYGDMGMFGQSCGLLVEDEQDTLRMQQMVHGRFWIARDMTGRATTVYRVFRWSAAKIVQRFGYDAVSSSIRRAYDQSNYGDTFDIGHAVEPRMDRDYGRVDKRNKEILSNYWEVDSNDRGGLLEESGFDSNPIIAPSWDIVSEDDYGTCPAFKVLGDVRMLQREQLSKLEAIAKGVNPPMTAPTSMRNNPASLLPGSITFSDDPSGKGYRPAMEVSLHLGDLRQDILEVQARINRGFYADLFLMLSNMEGIQPRNSFEIAERKEEKLLALGPVLENIYSEQLEPVIKRTIEIMGRRGMLPPAPVELDGKELKIEYTSILAQAQKAISTGAIERGFAFVAQMASVKPEVLDKINADETIDKYYDYLGIPPDTLISDDEVKKVRADRARQMQAAQATEAMATLAPAAKAGADAVRVASEAATLPAGGSLLERLGIG